ncbi:tubulin monoglutamylase TTLL4 isoform X2 [Mixophyes fleayi]|uniref:tubulin monoglutamylase TTLL4 isoform X2 n=1 Tax=Mixophyes fleayi TaxID=3061075 RepID=UPI003F4D73ED
MASVGTRVHNAELKCESHQKVPTCLGRPNEYKSNSPPSKIAPILKLERKNVNLAHYRRPVDFMVPHAYCFVSEPSKKTTSLTKSPPLTEPRSINDNLERSWTFHRPLNDRFYKTIGASLLGPKTEAQRPCSTSYRYLPIRPSLKLAKTDCAMTTSLIDQFHLHSASGELPEVNIRRPTSGEQRWTTDGQKLVAKLTSDTSRPALITNTFLRPSSAKVPLHLKLDTKKIQSPPNAGAKSASWPSGEKGDFGQTNGMAPIISHNGTGTGNISCKASSSNIFQGTAKTEDSTLQTLKHGVGSASYRGVQLTEAIRRITGSQDVLPTGSETSKPVCQKDEVYTSCVKSIPPTSYPVHQKDNIPCSLVLDGQCLNGDLFISSAHCANIYTKPIGTSLIANGGDSCNLGSSCQSVQTPDVKSNHQLSVGETTQRVNITVMASQISTIHLNKASDPGVSIQDLPVPNLVPDCAEEELLEGLDDSQEEEDEDEEDADDLSIITTPSTTLSDISRHCAVNMDLVPTDMDLVVKPALTQSLFPNTPPTIYFGTQDEKVEPLPWAQRKLMKWKMSTVTPIIVKQTVARSNFRVTKRNHDWLGCWGHHMKSTAFKNIRAYQKLNHFPGSFQIGRKDRLWRNLSKMQARFGRKEFNFFPQSFVLSQDIKLLKKAWEEGGTRQKWIVKPPASARGMGIQVIHKWSQLPKKRPLLVQRYLHKPYLISGSKFDLRIYVYVTSYDPLRVYLFTDGLVRFASCKYSLSMKSLSNKFMHLTNYSVNKKNVDYKDNTDETACQGHKWALKALWTYLNQQGFSSDKIWEKIKEMVIKTIIASEPYVNSLMKMYVQNPYSCHELFGFDIMLDENLKPWVLEVNISPSVSSVGKDRGRSAEMLNEEKMKRAHYLSQKIPDKELYATVLDQLTPEDVRVLVETEDELSRCGQFERVFPSPISSRYLRFFEQPRYFNILTNQWEQKYFDNRERGRDLLKNLCLMNLHTGSVPRSPGWSPQKSPGQSETHLNGFIVADVSTPSKLLSSSEERLKSFKTSSLHHSSGVHQHQDLGVRPSLAQTLSNVPESALVMS